MDLKEISAELVAGCHEGRALANLDKLYAEDAVSIEAADPSVLAGSRTWIAHRIPKECRDQRRMALTVLPRAPEVQAREHRHRGRLR